MICNNCGDLEYLDMFQFPDFYPTEEEAQIVNKILKGYMSDNQYHSIKITNCSIDGKTRVYIDEEEVYKY